MKNIKYIGSLAILFALLMGCGNSEPSPKDSATRDLKAYNTGNIHECIKRELYYNTQVDTGAYEHISIDYFSKIKDYTHENAIKLQEQLYSNQDYLTENKVISEDERQRINKEISSIKLSLQDYHKEVIGFVFVHRFKSRNDTFKNIFVMDPYCQYTEAIPLKSKQGRINPDDYRQKVKQLSNF